MSEERRLGRFYVKDHYDWTQTVRILAAAQEGCAVLRCEQLGYRRAFEVVACHPKFAVCEIGIEPPIYEVVLENEDGMTPKRVRFERA